jgi:hypothetical protein
MCVGIPAFHLTSDLDFDVAGVVQRDEIQTGVPVHDVLPSRLNIVTERRNGAYSGDDNARMMMIVVRHKFSCFLLVVNCVREVESVGL